MRTEAFSSGFRFDELVCVAGRAGRHGGVKTYFSVCKVSILFSYEKVVPLMVSGAVEGQFDGQSMCGIVAGSTQIY